MRVPRLSVTSLMVLAMILAVELAWLRWLLIERRSLFGIHPCGLDLGLIPMSGVLAMYGYDFAFRRKRSSPFRIGFLIYGSLSLIAYSTLCLSVPEVIDWTLRRIEPFISQGQVEELCRRISEPIGDFIFHGPNLSRVDLWQTAWVSVLLTLPQAMAAVVGGMITSKIRRPSVASDRQTR